MRVSLGSLLPVSGLLVGLAFGGLCRGEDAAASAASGGEYRWSVRAFGAKGDAETDDTAAFQAALEEAGKAGGGIVEVPAGKYRINGTLSIPANVTLQGIFRTPPTSLRRNMAAGGTVLLAYAGRGEPDGPAFLRLAGSNSSVAGLVVFYPEWRREDVPPIPYPPCILAQDVQNVAIQDCLLVNPYEGIRLIRAHRHLVRNVGGYPIWRGLYVDECYDIGRVENVHYWPFNVAYRPDDPYCLWINTQGTAFEFARTDWQYVYNTFCFGYGAGYKFSQDKHGGANGNFLGIGADCCTRAVLVEAVQPWGVLITNGEFVGRWQSQDSVTIEVKPEVRGKISLSNCSFWGPIERCVWMRAPNGWFSADNCHFSDFDVGGQGLPALQLDAGRTIVQGCSFARTGLHVQVGPEVVSAIVMGNQAEGGLRVENAAGRRTQIGLNEQDPIEWTPEALTAYRVQVGASYDGRYVEKCFSPENAGRPFRWTGETAVLKLPALPGKRYRLIVTAQVPPRAQSETAGLYLGDARIAPLAPTMTAELPAEWSDSRRVEIRCQGWVPRRHDPNSRDDRTLGVQLHGVIMLAEDVWPAAEAGTLPDRLFDANTGKWLSEKPQPE